MAQNHYIRLQQVSVSKKWPVNPEMEMIAEKDFFFLTAMQTTEEDGRLRRLP
jgi:hypothetical protein